MRDVILNFLEATESAAINSASFVAKGNKNQLDAVAVRSLRDTINMLPVSVNVVTGEGTIDNAPLLSMGEILGYGGRALDMAVDPVDGTSLAANGQANSVVSLSIAPQGSLQPLPDMYMEKMVCPVPYLLDMECSLEYNVRNVANALHKPTSELRVAVLNKPRHETAIRTLREMNVKVYLINDGDILASLDVMQNKYDFLYSIGGAPEGLISACIVAALNGDMATRLVSSAEFKQTSEEYKKYEAECCKNLNLQMGEILPLSRLVKAKDIFTILTCLTDCGDATGPEINESRISVNSIIVEGKHSCVTYMAKTKFNVN